MENLRIGRRMAGRDGDIWHVTRDRRWKALVNPDGTITIIHNGHDLYKVIEGVAYNTRKGTKVYGESYTAREIAEIVKNVTATL